MFQTPDFGGHGRIHGDVYDMFFNLHVRCLPGTL
jgi:hypothetical protein